MLAKRLEPFRSVYSIMHQRNHLVFSVFSEFQAMWVKALEGFMVVGGGLLFLGRFQGRLGELCVWALLELQCHLHNELL